MSPSGTTVTVRNTFGEIDSIHTGLSVGRRARAAHFAKDQSADGTVLEWLVEATEHATPCLKLFHGLVESCEVMLTCSEVAVVTKLRQSENPAGRTFWGLRRNCILLHSPPTASSSHRAVTVIGFYLLYGLIGRVTEK